MSSCIESNIVMIKPSKIVPMTAEALLHKYTQEGWEERLKAFHQEITERIWNSTGPKSTIKKRTVKTLMHSYLIGHVMHFHHEDGSVKTVVTLLVDGEETFHARKA